MGNTASTDPDQGERPTTVPSPTAPVDSASSTTDADGGYPPDPTVAVANPHAPSLTKSKPKTMLQRGVLDARGIERGACTRCPDCVGYHTFDQGGGDGPVIWRCTNCNCFPGVHEKITEIQAWGMDTATQAANHLQSLALDGSMSMPFMNKRWQCAYPGCQRQVKLDANTGVQEECCSDHVGHAGLVPPMVYTTETDLEVEDLEPTDYSGGPIGYLPQDTFTIPPPPVYYVQPPPTLPYDDSTLVSQSALPPDQTYVPPPIGHSGAQTCAIAECPNPCYVDGSGKVHDCCGYAHAMEKQRRLAIQQQNLVIKGVTHCLLDECSNLVWPFKNYCGRKHADIGIQRGLVPHLPVAAPQAVEKDKDPSLCLFPGCRKQKYVEGGRTHDYCGRTHAQQGAKMGIVATAEKEEDQCELPGCKKPKRQEGTRVHDYCCGDHATQDAPNRDARILTSSEDVKKFLERYKGSLTVVDRTENNAAKPGGELFRRYKAKWQSLPQDQRKSCLAFHGTAESNVDSICKNGYDATKRGSNVGQALGAGEYFATDPSTSLGYCKGHKIILNELLLGQQGVHHTQSGTIVVMKDPAHELPRFVITFK